MYNSKFEVIGRFKERKIFNDESKGFKAKSSNRITLQKKKQKKIKANYSLHLFHGVYLCLFFEMSIWEFITNSKKTRFQIKLDFFFEFKLDFYCLCSLQKSISKSNWFLNFLNLIFRNWKKIEWHSIFQKSSGDRQGDCLLPYSYHKLKNITQRASLPNMRIKVCFIKGTLFELLEMWCI